MRIYLQLFYESRALSSCFWEETCEWKEKSDTNDEKFWKIKRHSIIIYIIYYNLKKNFLRKQNLVLNLNYEMIRRSYLLFRDQGLLESWIITIKFIINCIFNWNGSKFPWISRNLSSPDGYSRSKYSCFEMLNVLGERKRVVLTK